MSPWVTLGAVALGGVIAAGAQVLAALVQDRLARRRERREARRVAYARLLTVIHEQRMMLLGSSPRGPDPTVMSRTYSAFAEVETFAPRAVRQAAELVGEALGQGDAKLVATTDSLKRLIWQDLGIKD